MLTKRRVSAPDTKGNTLDSLTVEITTLLQSRSLQAHCFLLLLRAEIKLLKKYSLIPDAQNDVPAPNFAFIDLPFCTFFFFI